MIETPLDQNTIPPYHALINRKEITMILRIILIGAACALVVIACVKQAKDTAVTEKKGAEEGADADLTGNVFFEEWDTPFGIPPFDRITEEDYTPAFEKAMELHTQEIAAIADNADPATFENTLEALDYSGELLTRVARVFFSQRSAVTNDKIQEIAQIVMPMLTRHRDNVLLNEKLFARIKAVHDKADAASLDPEQKTLLEETYKDFVRGGANLNREDKAALRKLNEELSVLQLNFSDNILKENNRFKMVLTKKEDLAGLPDRVIAASAEAAKKELDRDDAWLFTLHKPSLIPFLQFSEKRDLREKMFTGYIERGNNGDDLDNNENVSRIIDLRIKKANLLGYETFADFILDRKMAKTPAAVYGLLDEIWDAALPVAKKEAAGLQKMIDREGGKFKLQPWDWWYYAEKLRAEKYDLDESELRPYFKLENVRKGAFDLATRLYGVKFIPRDDVPKYHEDARVFEVTEADTSHVGILFVDYFPRKSKRGGAWCGGYRDQHVRNGKKITPLVTNVGNFSMPTEDKPALLSFEEVTTLFHEFGHALHALLMDVKYPASGSVKSDFVELPSQIMENWAIEPEMLKLYARHYETGEPIPDELIEKIQKAKNFNEGFRSVEYLAACYLDMNWHVLTEPPEDTVAGFEKKALDKIGLIPEIVVRYRSPYFAHIFSGTYYSAGYYSYIWSAVLDADAFEAFKETSLFDKETAASFRKNILSRGGAEDPNTLYVRFRGAKPDTKALLKRKGFL